MNPECASSDRGWALVSVLWSMTMLSVMAAATEQLIVANHHAERRAWDRLETSAVFDAVLTDAVAGIENPDATKRWRADGAPREIDFQGHVINVTVQDEDGRFDINVIDGRTLRSLLQQAGLTADESELLSDSILNWRSPDGPHASKGATDVDYKNAGLPYRPRHGDLLSVDELQLVLGMTPSVFGRIRDALTVYTRRLTINASVASKSALLALYSGDEMQVDAIMEARVSSQQTREENGFAERSVAPPAAPQQGAIYTVDLTTRLAKITYRQEVVVMITGDTQQPYITLAWKRT
jgi:general secretion pathway protein K